MRSRQPNIGGLDFIGYILGFQGYACNILVYGML